MSINIEAIKKKIAEISGRGEQRNELLQLEPGTHQVRLLPFQDDNDGQPLKELSFYYEFGRPALVAPKNGPDPVAELRRKLYNENTPDSKTMAKKLWPKTRYYAPAIVRGEEEKGVRLWSLNKFNAEKILGYFIDSDYGDITDPKKGFDLKVEVKQLQGQKFMGTDLQAKPRPSPLANDDKTIKELLKSIPEIDTIFQHSTYDELKARLDEWSAGGCKSGESTAENIESIVKELKKKPVAAASDDDDPSSNEKQIDDAFAEFMK